LIAYIPHKKIDKVKWDRCVEADPEAPVFFYSWFLDIVCDSWDGLVAGDYEAVFALPVKSKTGIQYIVQPFFTRTLAVCSSNKKLKEVSLFIEKIPGKFRLQEFCIETKQAMPVKSTESKERKYQVVYLDKSFTEIKKSFHNNTLQNLKKAVKNNLLVRSDVTATTIASDFKAIKGSALEKFSEPEYVKLKKLMVSCLSNGKGYARAVYDAEGNRVASAFFMHAHNRIVYLKGSTNETGKKTGAMHLLMSSMLEEFSNSNLVFDFGGSSIPSLARFFHGFGGTDVTYYTLEKNNLPLILRWIKSIKK
jgi:hypothetical protein